MSSDVLVNKYVILFYILSCWTLVKCDQIHIKSIPLSSYKRKIIYSPLSIQLFELEKSNVYPCKSLNK